MSHERQEMTDAERIKARVSHHRQVALDARFRATVSLPTRVVVWGHAPQIARESQDEPPIPVEDAFPT